MTRLRAGNRQARAGTPQANSLSTRPLAGDARVQPCVAARVDDVRPAAEHGHGGRVQRGLGVHGGLLRDGVDAQGHPAGHDHAGSRQTAGDAARHLLAVGRRRTRADHRDDRRVHDRGDPGARPSPGPLPRARTGTAAGLRGRGAGRDRAPRSRRRRGRPAGAAPRGAGRPQDPRGGPRRTARRRTPPRRRPGRPHRRRPAASPPASSAPRTRRCPPAAARAPAPSSCSGARARRRTRAGTTPACRARRTWPWRRPPASPMGPHPVIAVAQALGDVLQGDLRSALEVGDGAGHLHHPVRPPRAEVAGTRMRGRAWPDDRASSRQKRRRCRVVMCALAWTPLPANRSCCRLRAATTRSRTSADDSPLPASRRSFGGTRGTSRRRSMRSSRGPLRRLRYWRRR